MDIDLDDYYTDVPLPIIQDIEHLIKERKKKASPEGTIATDTEFELLVSIYNVWKKYFPNDYKQFIKTVSKIREDIIHSGNKGISKGTGEARLQHQLEIPEKLHQMIVIIFPNHKYTKKFVRKFVEVLPEFRVSDAKF